MRLILALVVASLFAPAAMAEGAVADDDASIVRPAGDSTLEDFHWHKRPVVVFADSPEDPLYSEQMETLEEGLDMLADRDVVILTDTDPAARSPIRMKLRPRGFMLVLIGKDGTILLRKPLPWTVRELTRSIDKLPVRQREVEDRRKRSE